MSRILDEDDAARTRESLERAHVRRTAAVVHRHDGARPLGEHRGNGVGTQVPGVRIDVREDRFCTNVHDGVRRCTECQRRRDHFIVRTDV